HRVSWVVLLPIGLAGLWAARHDDPGLGAVDAGLPRVGRLHELAVMELARVLAEVPDVPQLVLRVPVKRPFDRLAARANGVAHDRAGHAEDLLRLVRHGLDIGL